MLIVPANRPAPDTWLVCHGDSITAGYATTGYLSTDDKWFGALVAVAQSANRFGVINFGINGQGLNYAYSGSPGYGTLTADAVTRVDPVLNYVGTKKLVIFAGTNDIFLNGTSGAATWTLMAAYINARKSAAWPAGDIHVPTMLPRQGAHVSDIATFNSSVRSNAAGMGYVVIDFAANSTIGDPGDENNATNYLDTIHPTDAGHVIMASIARTALFP